jgi:predicted nucleic-acid-binding protein
MSGKSCSLDTNCIASLLISGREVHRKVVERSLRNYQEIVVADQVFIELEYVLNYPGTLTRAKIADAIKAILNLSEITCSRALLRSVLPIYVNHPALSFTDIYLAKKAGLDDVVPLLTFDKKLANQMPEAKIPS